MHTVAPPVDAVAVRLVGDDGAVGTTTGVVEAEGGLQSIAVFAVTR